MGLEVDQVLHGYAGGHRLLESSRKLSVDSQRAMLVLSDLAGPSIVPGFESYITGYPLQGENVFAFARTWYAPEMERPGCVWTHTLLLSPLVFDAVRSVSGLAQMFSRPIAGDFSKYSSPLALASLEDSKADEKEARLGPSVLNFVRVLAALYQEPGRSVISDAIEAEFADRIILNVWDRQHRALQNNFRFSSGSLSNRNRDTLTFDLQFFPTRVLQSQTRSLAGTELVVAESKGPSPGDWIVSFAEDFMNPAEEFRGFVRAVERDLPGSRETFAKVLRIYWRSSVNQVGGGRAPSEADFPLVSQEYPAPTEARDLKRWTLKGVQGHTTLEGKIEALTMLTTDAVVGRAYASVATDFVESIRDCISSDPAPFIRLAERLVSIQSTDTTRAFFRVLAEQVNESMAATILSADPALMTACLVARPSLFVIDQLWRDAGFLVAANTSILNDESLVPDSLVSRCVEPFLAAYRGRTLNASAAAGLRRLVGPVLTRANRLPIEGARSAVESLIAAHPAVTRAWCQANDFAYSAIELISNAMEPSGEWSAVSADKWTSALASAPQDASTSVRGLSGTSFVLALVLSAESHSAMYKVLPAVFEPIHAAAETESLPDRAWELLEPLVPRLSKRRNWDYCERLRRAIADKWLHADWPTSFLLAATRRPDTFQRIVEYCADSSERSELLQRMGTEVRQHPEAATIEQVRLLKRADIV